MPKRKLPIPLYFTSLDIENVRCFGERQRLNLTCGNGLPARWTLILGENGVGKTTLLQCLAWMRLVPESGFEIGAPEEGRDSAEPLPLTKGRLGPALPDEENEILESLLREGPDAELTLRASLSFDGSLSSEGKNAKGAAGRGKTLMTGVQLFFDAKGELSEFKKQGRPKVETTLGGEFHEPLVIAYGANRHLGVRNLSTGDLDDPIASRLAGPTELYDIEEMLRDLHHNSKVKGTRSREHKQLKRLQEALARILPGDEFQPNDVKIFPPDVLNSRERSGVCLKTRYGLIPLSALSLGYQTTMAWAADLAWRMLQRFPGSPNPLAEPAVVLIDEIDLHLHPLWQLSIIDDISKIFPNTQFIATSHSPLMVQVAETANLVLLRSRQTDVEIVKQPEVVRSWRVDQILTSELFAVPIERNRQTELLFARRDELVDKPSPLTAEEAAELRGLRLRISELPTAQDPEDQKAMDLVRRAAALLKRHKVVEP